MKKTIFGSALMICGMIAGCAEYLSHNILVAAPNVSIVRGSSHSDISSHHKGSLSEENSSIGNSIYVLLKSRTTLSISPTETPSSGRASRPRCRRTARRCVWMRHGKRVRTACVSAWMSITVRHSGRLPRRVGYCVS